MAHQVTSVMLFHPETKSNYVKSRFANAVLPVNRKDVCPAGGADLITVVNVDHRPGVFSRKPVKCFVVTKSMDDVNKIFADRSFTPFGIRLNVK